MAIASADRPCAFHSSMANADKLMVGGHNAAVIARDQAHAVADAEIARAVLDIEDAMLRIKAIDTQAARRHDLGHSAIAGAAKGLVATIDDGTLSCGTADDGCDDCQSGEKFEIGYRVGEA